MYLSTSRLKIIKQKNKPEITKSYGTVTSLLVLRTDFLVGSESKALTILVPGSISSA